MSVLSRKDSKLQQMKYRNVLLMSNRSVLLNFLKLSFFTSYLYSCGYNLYLPCALRLCSHHLFLFPTEETVYALLQQDTYSCPSIELSHPSVQLSTQLRGVLSCEYLVTLIMLACWYHLRQKKQTNKQKAK